MIIPEHQNRLTQYFVSAEASSLAPTDQQSLGPINRVSAYLDSTKSADYHQPTAELKGYERRRYPEAAHTLEEHLAHHDREARQEDLSPPICAKDLITVCNEKTGPVGIISIPVDESRAELVKGLLLKGQELRMFRKEDIVQINHGVVQFAGFVSDQEGLDRVHNKILILLKGEEGVECDHITRRTITPQQAPYYRRPQHDPRVSYELMDLALDPRAHATVREHNSLVWMSLPPGYQGLEVQRTYLDVVNSLHPKLLGGSVRAVFTPFADKDKTGLAYIQKDEFPKGKSSILSGWDSHAESIDIRDDELPLSHLGIGPKDFVVLSAEVGKNFDYISQRDSLKRRGTYQESL